MPKLLLIILAVSGSFARVGTLLAETFEVDGVRIHYIVEGQGEPVILIHGLRSSARGNWQMPGILGILSKDYRVIALDMPGHGESDRPENDDA